ncbi:MAG: ATP-binding protein [Flavobacteriaceae bacterium]|nr:ATP-binding protein [Flavobacteriaceae bacterium]
MNNLYGNRFIEKLVSSGYKSPTYAIAEIIDNSIDAKAKNIEIVLIEENTREGGRYSKFISDVFFIDDGNGMDDIKINGCLKFSDGEGASKSRIGAFGVGLPNSSIFVGRRVEVYSKDSTGKWNYVFLDLDDQARRGEPGYDDSIVKTPNFKKQNLYIDVQKNSTIVRWSKIRNIGARKSETVIDRTQKLIGRIYRYALDNVSITFSSKISENKDFDIKNKKTLPYDPLFLKESRSQITDLVWELATTDKNNAKNYLSSHGLEDKENFNTKYHYKKFIKGCEQNETILPLFQKFDNYWNVKQVVLINRKKYTYTIRASFANKSIAHPGIRSGGKTRLGQEIRNKMVGTPHFNGGNISFIRNDREIDCGSYGLYSLTTEKERFWTIEIHFDSDLDKLIGLDYQKQNIAYRLVNNGEIAGIADIERSEDLRENEQQLILFHKISEDIKACIKQIRKLLRGYSREFIREHNAALKEIETGEKEEMPEVEPAVFRVLPSGREWTEPEKEDFVKFFKKRYMSISIESISEQVEKFAKGLHKTVVLYNSDNTGNLFDITTVRGKTVTFINTEHLFYKNIIEPLKENKTLNVFTSAIEMLICSYAYEMVAMTSDNSNHEGILKQYLRKISDRLQNFISDGYVHVDVEYWREKLEKEEDDDENEELEE